MSDIRTRLIDATFEEVYQKGYHTASLSKILELANTKKGSMYHYFPSKKAMVLAMIEEKHKVRIENFWQELKECEENILETFIHILKGRDKNFKNGCPLGNILQECSNLDEDFVKVIDEILTLWEELFKEALTKAIEKEEIKEIDVDEVALFLIALYEGALLLSKKSASSKEYSICINQLEIFLNSLKEDTLWI